jgi:glycine/D-amino acid oxidase-like deaminating enzyme
VRGFWIAAGMSGHGFKLSPAVGEMVAALVTGARSPVSPTPFRLGRFDSTMPSTTFVSSYLGSSGPSSGSGPDTR